MPRNGEGKKSLRAPALNSISTLGVVVGIRVPDDEQRKKKKGRGATKKGKEGQTYKADEEALRSFFYCYFK